MGAEGGPYKTYPAPGAPARRASSRDWPWDGMAGPAFPSKRRWVPVPLEETAGRYTPSLSTQTA